MPSLPLHHTHGSADTLSLHSYHSGFILNYTLGPLVLSSQQQYRNRPRVVILRSPSLKTTLCFFSLRYNKTLLCFTQTQPVICSTLPRLSPLDMHQASVPHLLLEARSETEETELSCQHEVTVYYISWIIHPWLPFKSRAALGVTPAPPLM